jgi:ATP-dependent Lon protease
MSLKMKKLESGGNGSGGKKNKYLKILNNFFKNLTNLSNHLEFLFKNKYIEQDFYIEKMYALNDLNYKLTILEENISKKNNKKFLEEYIIEINDFFEKIAFHIGSDSIINLLKLFSIQNDFFNEKSEEYNEILNLYNSYFIPTKLSITKISEEFMKNNNIDNIKNINVIEQQDLLYRRKKLIDKIDGACIIIYINDNKILLINGLFKKDSLGIIKKYPVIEKKNKEILKEIEYLDIPDDFKEKYLEQLSLKEFIIQQSSEICEILKNDYEEFLKFKSKSLSLIVKEFIKMNAMKQRKMLILFLIYDNESQFTAHIIYDLINDQSFLFENEKLSEVLFNSLHWKIQKIFKISETNFESQKKKLENINVNDIPYESKILSLKAPENIKAKAIEKLKEINGSKENSIKAQQWLDGFLKIPFGVYKKEKIIDFFGSYQKKIECFVNNLALKLSDFDIMYLDLKNQEIYNNFNNIINEYYSYNSKSEHTFNKFNELLTSVYSIVKSELLLNYEHMFKHIETDKESNDYLSFENQLLIDENNLNEFKNELDNFKKIKDELYSSDIINKSNLKLMINKLNEIESKINKNLLKNDTPCLNDDEDYDKLFIKFIVRNCDEMNNLINEWNSFKLDKKKYIENVDKVLDKCTYGQTEAKLQMKRIIGQWMNGNSKGQCLGLCGPAGVGKTTLSKNGISKCLVDEDGNSRPFGFLPLGGATNGSILEGHHYTYLGSTWGKIVDILMETKCMNPIIYIDELDKVSKTEHGKEIISILTHATDQSQNQEFYDKYFASVPIDLSQVLFIFSYNNRDSIDSILLDRIQEIHIKPLSGQEKLIISKNYVIPEINKNIGFDNDEIIFDNEIISEIILNYTYEAGVRKLNEIYYDILRDINLKRINQEDIEIPFHVSKEYVEEILKNKPKMNLKSINSKPQVGLVNGLYATQAGLGGLTIIQSKETFSDKKFGIEKLTGSQGDVMKESMSCALTVLNNIIDTDFKKKFLEENEKFGIHIHCPEAATPKDGPSAGLAITLCLVSLMTNIPVKNTVAMTGEIDLEGKAHEIGGLYSKIQGAMHAGAKEVLIPRTNEKDFKVILIKEEQESISIKKSCNIKDIDSFLLLDKNSYQIDKNTYMFRNTVKIRLVDNIYDILKYALMKNNMKFNKL